MAIPFPIGTFVNTFLDQSKDDARRLIRHEMESMLDPLVESLFKQLKGKFVDYVGDSCPTVCFHQTHQIAHDDADNGQMIRDDQPTISNAHKNQSLSKAPSMDVNCQLNSTNHQPALMLIKQINDPSMNVQLEQHQNLANSSSSAHEPSLLSEPMIPSNPTDELLSKFEILKQQHPPIKHNEFVEYDDDDEDCDCDECVYGGIDLKEEDDNDGVQLIDSTDQESSPPVKKARLDSTQSNNAQPEVTRHSTRQPTDDEQMNKDRPDRGESEQSEAIDTRATIEHYDQGQYNSDESMMIQQEERDANNAIGEESIATECTTNPIKPNRHLQCSHCLKSCVSLSALYSHFRVHTGERPFECDQCDKRFSERFNLIRHQLIHQNVKRFQCHHCEKQFTQKCNLETHEQAIHLHVKPYRCKVCGHTATKRSDVITHVRIVHFGLPRTIREQRARNIIDHRDPRELIEKV